MQTVHTTEVTEDQIDHLGHMNVRFYGQHAHTGAYRLAGSLGLADPSTVLLQRDRYVRHHREQLLGSALEVRGGVLDADERRVQLYEELTNSGTGEVAATFVISLAALDPGTGRERHFYPERLADARAAVVALPDHGRSRSIPTDGDPTQGAPDMETLASLGLAMREVRTVTDAECDRDGLPAPGAATELVWGGVPLPGREFEPFHDTPSARIGWATMETRGTWARVPSPGDRVQSFGAEVEIASKTMLSRNWVYDVEDGELICAFSVVNLAFDVDARKAVVIPDDLRRKVSQRLQPDLGFPGG